MQYDRQESSLKRLQPWSGGGPCGECGNCRTPHMAHLVCQYALARIKASENHFSYPSYPHIGLSEIKAALTFLKLMGGIKEATEALAAAQEIREVV